MVSIGERGPRGDHGQDGERGPRGSRGPGISITTLILVVVLPLFAYLYANSVDTVDTLRAGCERINILRQSSYDNFLSDAASREAAALEFKGEAKEAFLKLARQNRQAAQHLVDATKDVSTKSIHSPLVDCEVAYPKPWPLD